MCGFKYRMAAGIVDIAAWRDPNAAQEDEGLPPQPQALISVEVRQEKEGISLRGRLEDYATTKEIFAAPVVAVSLLRGGVDMGEWMDATT